MSLSLENQNCYISAWIIDKIMELIPSVVLLGAKFSLKCALDWLIVLLFYCLVFIYGCFPPELILKHYTNNSEPLSATDLHSPSDGSKVRVAYQVKLMAISLLSNVNGTVVIGSFARCRVYLEHIVRLLQSKHTRSVRLSHVKILKLHLRFVDLFVSRYSLVTVIPLTMWRLFSAGSWIVACWEGCSSNWELCWWKHSS